MNTDRLSGTGFNSISVLPQDKPVAQESSRQRAERSRKILLGGWITSLIGIMSYCYVMIGSDQHADLLTNLVEHGAVGWMTLLVVLIGIGLWFVGCVGVLSESGDTSSDEQ